ncbi:MAG: hypothetical protein Q4C95_08910 [Planctomycetia bacterium]|nr:hypothetical protein [Planctomycetia bacterium]
MPTIEKLDRFNEPLVVQFMSVRVDLEAIQAIQKVKKIQGLLFDKCRFDNDDWSDLNMVPWKTSDELSSLIFSRCEPFDAVSKIVSLTPKLEHLDLWGIDLSRKNAQTFLNDFDSLTSLTLIGCKLSDNFIQELSRKKIRHLTLNRISLSEKDAEILSRFSFELESLQLIHCDCPNSLNALKWNPSLKILKIDE